MPQKRNKTSSKSRKQPVHAHTTTGEREIEHAILKNLVELQKVNVSMAEKFDQLTKETSQLLALFELTARNFAKNVPQTEEYTRDKEFLEKIDKLLDQNKTLAKGLTLMEERLRERMYSPAPTFQRPNPIKRSEENPLEPSPNSSAKYPPRF